MRKKAQAEANLLPFYHFSFLILYLKSAHTVKAFSAIDILTVNRRRSGFQRKMDIADPATKILRIQRRSYVVFGESDQHHDFAYLSLWYQTEWRKSLTFPQLPSPSILFVLQA